MGIRVRGLHLVFYLHTFYTANVYTEKLLHTAGFHTQQAFGHKGFYLHTEAMAGGLAQGN